MLRTLFNNYFLLKISKMFQVSNFINNKLLSYVKKFFCKIPSISTVF